jgi:hypothetical protein
LTNRCHRYSIADKSSEGQDASLRVKREKVQLVLPPPRRPDTYITKFAGWPQPLGILSVETYIKQNNPGVEVEILDGNKVLTLNERAGLMQILSEYQQLQWVWCLLTSLPTDTGNTGYLLQDG